MTRWLLLFLMVLLPAQFAWAVAAPYCAHESDPTSFHVGHHVHVHRASSAADAQQAPLEQEAVKGSPVLDHGDCSVCHGMAGQFASPVELHFELPVRRGFLPPPPTPMGNGREDSIERPQWERAA